MSLAGEGPAAMENWSSEMYSDTDDDLTFPVANPSRANPSREKPSRQNFHSATTTTSTRSSSSLDCIGQYESGASQPPHSIVTLPPRVQPGANYASPTNSPRPASPGVNNVQKRPIGWGVRVPFPPRNKPRPVLEGQRTTVIVRNLCSNFTRERLMAMLDGEGFAGQYDFLYLPIRFKTGTPFGYACINLISHQLALQFMQKFACYRANEDGQVCQVEWSTAQGLRALVDRYRDSPLMQGQDDRLPAIYFNGMRVVFPPPLRRAKER